MGKQDLQEEFVILIADVKRVFIEPTDIDFKGFYNATEWLPTSPTQDDPFYKKQINSKDIIELRKEITRHVMDSTKDINKDIFISAPHDFSIAARNAICYAFRQSITEKYFNPGEHWKRIVDIYYTGHWPVGYAKEKFIVI